MNYTANLNLKKPEQTEFYDVDDFNDNADAIDTALMARLQLAGGTMTGKITQSQDIAINRNVNTASVIIAGGISENEGGRINLYGKDNTTNQGFSVNANDVQLVGKPTGELKWNGKNIVRSVSGIDADINGNIELSKIVTSSAELNALPVGDYFFSGSMQAEDPDSVIAGTDFNGISMYRAGQATQVLFQGKKIFFRLDDSATVGKAPTYGAWVELITGNNVASTTEYGITKLADETAALSENDEAAVPVPLMYEINDFRRMNKAYNVGDKVSCAFEYEFFLECTQAGTTNNETLDTRNVAHGQVITDGTVQWTVRTHIRSINGVVANSQGDVDINRKFYKSLESLGLNYATVTFADIINALPVNSTLTFYVDVVTSQPTYAPNLQIPASGLVIVVKGASDTVPTLFYLNPIVKGYTSYTGQYTTYNDYGFSGWQPMVLSVNAIKPNINGNVTLPIATYAPWKWSGNGITIDGYTITFTNGFKMAIWYMLFPAKTNKITVNFLTPFNAPPCVLGSIVVRDASIHLIPNVFNITATSVTCVTNNSGSADPTATYWVAMGYNA